EISDVTINFDDIGGLGPRRITVFDEDGNAIDPFSLEHYELTGATSSHRKAKDTFRSAYLNFSRDLGLTVPVTIKTGIDVRQHVRARIRDNGSWSYVGPASALGALLDPALSAIRPPFGLPHIEW